MPSASPAGTQSTTLFVGDHPFSVKHPQDNFSLQNANWRPPKCKSTPSKKGLATSNLQCWYRNTQEISPPQFTFWRLSICILEAEIVLGVLYRKGGPPKGVLLQVPPKVGGYLNLKTRERQRGGGGRKKRGGGNLTRRPPTENSCRPLSPPYVLPPPIPLLLLSPF